ncbi:hypothetical protein TA3x_000019 [Tundrisphaera sp. TA3]|uniref:hypothetical protein n=1 Tax=Tundrisphaera sp. TA3 TaxID=3435775 RepID=UPI003EB8E206
MNTRRWRRDDLTRRDAAPPGVSGRWTVAVLVAGVLALWFGLDRGFRAWKARHEARAAFGMARVAPAIDPLAAVVPPDVAAEEWRRAVAATHAMLVALTGAGVLDEPDLERLRRQVAGLASRARPETARAELAGLWDDLEHRVGPIIAPDHAPPPAGSRHAARHPRPPRPGILGPSKPRAQPGR